MGKCSRQSAEGIWVVGLLFWFFFRVPIYWTHHGQFHKVIATLEVSGPSHPATSVFSAHPHKLSPLIHKIAKRTIPVRMTKVSVPRMRKNLKTTLKTSKTERKRKISLQMLGTPVVPTSRNSSKSSLYKHERTHGHWIRWRKWLDLGDDEERILNHNIPSDDDDESAPKWKLNLSERAQHSSSRKARLDKTYLF